ncbi:hypothetical protein [Arthrobacter crystallopoietes]|uniref:YtxH domain-containing protein n=1 Tax=Crystallibacter crystallopoietes TaxID=37928 RepID=A0A1H1GLX9_9MICC|nr:hypothetical protein [Arthrobacter crystallopoietes]AUI52491.1 hypothetical protein AC20117_18525 [Arthrobacter crystallopoietes]SDR14190.1 hypothetical protein SAMN04489742_4170 [Arthrobacter crystallopoietes]
MKNKLILGAGLAVGFVLGSRAGRGSYEQLRDAAQELWASNVSRNIRQNDPVRSGSSPGSRAGRRASSWNAWNSDAGASSARTGAAGSGAADIGAAEAGRPETRRDVSSDPAMDDRPGGEWAGEGGALADGPATGTDPEENLGHS